VNARRLHLRRRKEQAFLSGLIMMTVIALFPFFHILALVFIKGLPQLSLRFLTRLPAPAGMVGGMGNAVLGTLTMVGLASAISLPLGIGTGVYMALYATTRYAAVLRFVADVLSGVPTILLGLLVYGLMVVTMGSFSGLAGAVALSWIMFPSVARSSEQMVLLVPVSLREAALALGATRMQTVLYFVLPTAARGLTTAALLAVARVMGETAPLLFTAFGNAFWQNGLSAPMAALPLQIFIYATSPYPLWQAQAWTGALTLLLLIVVIHAVARWLTRARQ